MQDGSRDDPDIEELVTTAREWMEADPDRPNRDEVAAIIERRDADELRARFGSRLRFGTAGLRAAVGAGPMRMNRVVARQTAAGIARVIRDEVTGGAELGVVVAHDARYGSDSFAADMADVLAGAGVVVHILDGPAPTPLAAFAVRQVPAAAAVVVTASHNPPNDNGIKVFWADGAQIAPPLDARIAAAIQAPDGSQSSSLRNVVGAPTRAPVEHLGAPTAQSELARDYLLAAESLVPGPPDEPLPLAVTALHGVGGALLVRALEGLGHGPVHQVVEQADPDPRFPTVEFPNPEEPGAMDRVVDLARRTASALALALDPDADRLAVAAEDPGGIWRVLTGDEVGALLTWRRLQLTQGIAHRLVVTTIVSSRLVAAMARASGSHFAETLTGFKWLCRPALDHPEWHQVIAYEEALGYAVGPAARDKDGITAAVVVADLVCALAASGRTVFDVLDDLARAHGSHVTRNGSLRLGGADADSRMEEVSRALASGPPEALGGLGITRFDRPAGDVVRLRLEEDSRVVLRPSGTEAKFKYYCEAIEPVAAGEPPADAVERANRRLDRIESDMLAMLGQRPADDASA